MLTQDNTELRKKVNLKFDEGDMKFSKGTDLDTKEQGIRAIMEGMNLGENGQMQENLKNKYKYRYEDLEKKLAILEGFKKNGVTGNSGGSGNIKAGNNAKGGSNNNSNDNKDDDSAKFQGALSEAIVTEKPNIKWTDIAGLENAKKAIQEAVILPIKFPELFVGARIPWKGILLYGPPGTGKTYMAKACATEAEGTFFSISSSDLISKYVGESERLIKTLFTMAREKKPSIIFIDEIDSLCGARGEGENEASRRVKTEFLVQMEGVGHDDRGVLVLGATNLPWALDSAIRRRFQKRIYIPLPDFPARQFMVKHHLKNTQHNLTEEQINQVAQKIDGFSGSDITILVRDAVMEPVRQLQSANYFREVLVNGAKKYQPVSEQEANMPGVRQVKLYELNQSELDIPIVTMLHFEASLKRSKASVSQDQLKDYVEFTSDFGQEG